MWVVPVVGVGWVGVGEVLVEGSSSGEGEHLHAEADGEDWGFGVVVELGDEVGFERLACGEDGGDFGVGWGVEGFGDGIVSSREDEGVEAVDEGLEGCWV